MFGDDSFLGIEDLFNQLTKSMVHTDQSRGFQNQGILSTVELPDKTILVFDLSGEKVSSVKIKNNLEDGDYENDFHSGQKILEIKLEGGSLLKYSLPKALSQRKTTYTFINGILEVSLKK